MQRYDFIKNNLLELPSCNASNFQVFLDEMSLNNPVEYKIVVFNNGAFHKAKSLIIPKNISLVFLSPYSPELNPAEKMWARFKRAFTNREHNELKIGDEIYCDNTYIRDFRTNDRIEKMTKKRYAIEVSFTKEPF